MIAAGPGRTDRYLLLLGATMALRERAIIAAVRVFPGPIVTIAPTPLTRSGKFFDHVLRGVVSDPEAALSAVRAFEHRTGLVPAGVVPLVDGLLMAGWAIADHYGVPYLSRAAVEDSSINKNVMKDRFQAAGLATPRYVVVEGEADVDEAVARFGLPCVIKPCAFGGSLGVRLIERSADAAAAYRYVRAVIDQTAATFTVKNRAIQVEEFCPLTDEVSVEVLNHRDWRTVLAVTDKSLGAPPYFAEIGHRVPSRYSERQDVCALAIASCAAIGLDRGVAHVEIRLEPDKPPVLMEVGARTAGDGILDLVERSFGISGYELHVRGYLDQLDEPPTVGPARGVAAIAMLKAPAGRISGLEVPTALDPAVSSYEVSVQVGDVSAADAANYLTREGYVECFWPGAGPTAVPREAHVHIAETLSEQIFRVSATPA